MTRWHKRIVCNFCFLVAAIGLGNPLLADNPDFPGYLGVYVVEGNGGMQITSFIRDTPAAALAAMGEISRGDTILRLAGKNTLSLQQLRQARNSIPMDKEAKMVIRNRNGRSYHVWISRNEPTAAMMAPADTFRRGGPGEGQKGIFAKNPAVPRGPLMTADPTFATNKPAANCHRADETACVKSKLSKPAGQAPIARRDEHVTDDATQFSE